MIRPNEAESFSFGFNYPRQIHYNLQGNFFFVFFNQEEEEEEK